MADFVYTDRSSMKGRLILVLCILIFFVIIGTFFYHYAEDWSYVDSFYFAAISLSTRGYGELHPSTAIAKIFTVGYLLLGVALIVYTLSNFIGYFIKYQEPAIKKKIGNIASRISPPKKDRWVVINPRK